MVVYQLLVCAHLLAAIVWLGGMFFAYFCLRPAAIEVLEPPQRLPLWAATLARFLRCVAIAVAVLLASGLLLLLRAGFPAVPLGWHLMLTLGLLMTAIFAHIYLRLYPQLCARCTANAWADAAQTLNAIRRLVATNLILGVCIVAAAISAR